MKNFKLFTMMVLAMLACAPLLAQSSGKGKGKAAAAAAEEEVQLKTGVRFVTCSPDGARMPAPLFAKVGKTYKQLRISGRNPSIRLRPEGGKIYFYDQDPTPVGEDEDTKGKGKGKSKTAAAKDAAPEIEPVFTVTVPEGMGTKRTLGIIIPNADIKKTRTIFLDEADLPKSGIHILNLSSFPITMSTSDKGDFSDAKKKKIAVYKSSEGITPENSWSLRGSSDGQIVNYMMEYLNPATKKMTRLKSSKLAISARQCSLTFIVATAKSKRPTLLNVNLMDDSAPKASSSSR